jgi:tetratricopeptide (TPR) repeat protein
MNIHFKRKEFQQASQYANTILLEEVVEDAIYQQAHLVLAKTNFEKENYQKAIEHLNTLKLLKNRVGAESKYLLARTFYLQGKYLESDSLIFMLVDQVPSFPFWIAKGFILLADNFIAKEDVYNARLTFQSVIDNADDKELVSIAQDKLEMLNAAEEKKMEKEKEVIEIEMGNSEVKNPVIFEVDTTMQEEEKGMNEKKESDEK